MGDLQSGDRDRHINNDSKRESQGQYMEIDTGSTDEETINFLKLQRELLTD